MALRLTQHPLQALSELIRPFFLSSFFSALILFCSFLSSGNAASGIGEEGLMLRYQRRR